jgi:hypothetical protein
MFGAVAITICLVFVAIVIIPFYLLANTKGLRYVSPDSRQMYADLAKTLVTSAGIASSIIVGTYSRGALPAWMIGRALVSFVICIVCSTIFMLALSRLFEVARSRAQSTEGQLENWELVILLVFGGVSFCSFLLGFLYVGRIGYTLH